jgi:osmotically-inducible protein OsmY
MLFPGDRLRKKIAERLLQDRRFDASGISVEVSGGKVILGGTAKTYQSAALAEVDAAEVSGVVKVVNRIKVPFPEKIAPPTDEAIRARIQAALSLYQDCRPVDLVLAVADGVVFIDGFVESLKDKKRITSIAAKERGVLDVHNNLVVIDSPDRKDKETRG